MSRFSTFSSAFSRRLNDDQICSAIAWQLKLFAVDIEKVRLSSQMRNNWQRIRLLKMKIAMDTEFALYAVSTFYFSL